MYTTLNRIEVVFCCLSCGHLRSEKLHSVVFINTNFCNLNSCNRQGFYKYNPANIVRNELSVFVEVFSRWELLIVNCGHSVSRSVWKVLHLYISCPSRYKLLSSSHLTHCPNYPIRLWGFSSAFQSSKCQLIDIYTLIH